MKNITITFFAALVLLFTANFSTAQSFPDNWQSYDLAKYGMSFSFMAPASASFDWDGDMDELYINAEEDEFRMMISIYEETVEELVAEYKEEVEEDEDFEVSYVHDEANGFLAKVVYDGEADYNIYYAFAKGGKTFFFQANPMTDGSLYSATAGERMFQACKAAAEK